MIQANPAASFEPYRRRLLGRALYVVRNPDKLRHLATAPLPPESGRA